MAISSKFPVKADGLRPHCAAPGLLAVVDAAYERPGGPAGKQMREVICPGCPIGDACLAWAMCIREEGVWGGSSNHARTRHGGPPKPSYAVQHAETHGLPAPERQRPAPVQRGRGSRGHCSICGEEGHKSSNQRHKAVA